jgi:hypothetical protein
MTDEPKKRKHGKHPYAQLSLEYLRGLGVIPAMVERIIPMPTMPFPKKQDLFGIFDILYLDPGLLQVGFVQVTSWACRRDHIKKMEDHGETIRILWSIPSARTILHAWRKVGRLWEINVWETRFEYVQGGQDRVALQLVQAPAMAEARAMARTRERSILEDIAPPQTGERTIRRIP